MRAPWKRARQLEMHQVTWGTCQLPTAVNGRYLSTTKSRNRQWETGVIKVPKSVSIAFQSVILEAGCKTSRGKRNLTMTEQKAIAATVHTVHPAKLTFLEKATGKHLAIGSFL